MFFFFNDTATTEIYTLSLHDALPICAFSARMNADCVRCCHTDGAQPSDAPHAASAVTVPWFDGASPRSEEHTSELQSRQYLVCRLLLEKKKNITASH